MFLLYLIACFKKAEECNLPFTCEAGFNCKVCCEVGGENCRTQCSDGWTDVIPPAVMEEELQNDICHCLPSLDICQ